MSSTIPPIISIRTINDWYDAIKTSQDPTKASFVSIYELKNDLVFDVKNPVYISDGNDDSEYLFIRGNQEFRGNSFTLFLNENCFGDQKSATGLFRMQGSSSYPALLKDVNIEVRNLVIENKGSILTSSLGTLDPQHVSFYNINVNFLGGYMETGGALLVNHFNTVPINISFSKVILTIENLMSYGGRDTSEFIQMAGFIQKGQGMINLTDCYVRSRSMFVSTEMNFSLFLGSIQLGQANLIGCISELPNQAGELMFIGEGTNQANILCKNSGSITGSSNSFYDGLFFVIGSVDRSCTATIVNYYSNTNKDNSILGVVNSNFGIVNLQNINNRYLINAPPTKKPERPDVNPPFPNRVPYHEKKTSKKHGQKKILLIVISVLGGFILALIILWLIASFRRSKKSKTKTVYYVKHKKPSSVYERKPVVVLKKVRSSSKK